MNYMILSIMSMGSGVRGSVRGSFFTRHPAGISSNLLEYHIYEVNFPVADSGTIKIYIFYSLGCLYLHP